MKSEIAWLMEAFLVEEDVKSIRKMIAQRMAEVTENMTMLQVPQRPVSTQSRMEPAMANQSPSMQRMMMESPELIPKVAPPVTPAAAQALAMRQALINKAEQADDPSRAGRTKR